MSARDDDGPTWQAIVTRNHWALAIMLAGLLGLIEGALSAPGSDSGEIGRWTYWGILFVTPFIALTASIGIGRAIAHLPLIIVVQDWLSLVAQGKAPQDEYWYEAVFGSNVLTWHAAYLPNFYYIGFAASVIFHVGLDVYGTWKTKMLVMRRQRTGDWQTPKRLAKLSRVYTR